MNDEQYLHLCGINIKDLSIPNFVTTVILKFKWEDQHNKKLKAKITSDVITMERRENIYYQVVSNLAKTFFRKNFSESSVIPTYS